MTAPLKLDDAERPAPSFLDGKAKQLLIDGAWTAPRSAETFDTVDPTTGRALARVSSAGQEDVDLAVAAARRAFEAPSWADITPYERSRVLLQIADVLEEHTDELAVLDSLDMGGPLWMTRWLVEHSVEVFRHYAGWPTKIYGQTAPSDPAAFNYTLRQPLGVVGAITAWNGPILQLAWKLGPALATGNTVVAKPAAWSPLSALRIGELLTATDLPPGVVNIVSGGAASGEALTGHGGVDKISFTGSLAVGKRILAASGNDLKRVTLELGGKSPTIVFDDADLKAAAKGAVAGFAQGSGEGCVAGSRILVQESVRERFRELLVQEMHAYTLGDPFHPDTRMGPLASRRHFERVSSYLESAREDGGTLETVGPTGHGLYMPPTFVEGVGSDARVVREEVFGPVASLMAFTDAEDAIAQGNDTVYGLSASVWTSNLTRAHRTAARLRAGTVWINAFGDMSAGTVPFGGFKQSGIGREHGIEVLDAYTETKTVMVHF
ncbi:aldehyde dehydrogenase family protein [Streptomonospora wellingtoniae]|uniref:Aldehyde dehydrogenase family protein n=1 Tax=Streptomonospora wellingtoniae TaxID=3075544 RepID=A0ABU2KWC6_9ACTN|nr:aldehyde dehydrogenase family protein [Streptomonospora sp. DSM 45055]MDT0303604.1 aldehyde dehydrogenase family protein [Streptomonospora sp. DSM 45055]